MTIYHRSETWPKIFQKWYGYWLPFSKQYKSSQLDFVRLQLKFSSLLSFDGSYRCRALSGTVCIYHNVWCYLVSLVVTTSSSSFKLLKKWVYYFGWSSALDLFMFWYIRLDRDALWRFKKNTTKPCPGMLLLIFLLFYFVFPNNPSPVIPKLMLQQGTTNHCIL